MNDLFGDSDPNTPAPDANRLDRPLGALFDEVPEDWRPLTDAFRRSEAGHALIARVDARRQAGAVIHPGDVFAALRLTRRQQVRAVILGQDPYHGPGQAHGLAFSVPPGVKPPPSLRNMFKELQRDVGVPVPRHGDLRAWAAQGVLLLNSSLTVESGCAGSHAGWGWEALTDLLLQAVAAEGPPKVFALWGASAQRKAPLVEAAGAGRHLLLCSNHPSPLSATRGPVPFIGCGHFGRMAAFFPDEGPPWG